MRTAAFYLTPLSDAVPNRPAGPVDVLCVRQTPGHFDIVSKRAGRSRVLLVRRVGAGYARSGSRSGGRS
jgi:hypothetical protein